MSPNRVIKVPAPRALTPFSNASSNDQTINKTDSLSSSFSSASVSSLSSLSSSSISSETDHSHQFNKLKIDLNTSSAANSQFTQTRNNLSSIIPSPDSPDALIQSLIDTYYYTENSNMSNQNCQTFQTYPAEETDQFIVNPRRRLPPPPLNLTKSNFTELERNGANQDYGKRPTTKADNIASHLSGSQQIFEHLEKKRVNAGSKFGQGQINNNINRSNHIHQLSFTEHVKQQNKRREVLNAPNLNVINHASSPCQFNPPSQIESILPAACSRALRKISQENLKIFHDNNPDCRNSSAFPRHVADYVYDNSTTDIAYMENDDTTKATANNPSSKSPISFTSASSLSFSTYSTNPKVNCTKEIDKNYEYTTPSVSLSSSSAAINTRKQIHNHLFNPCDATETSHNTAIFNGNNFMTGTEVESLDSNNSNFNFSTTNRFTNTRIDDPTEHISHLTKKKSESFNFNSNVIYAGSNPSTEISNNIDNEKKQLQFNYKKQSSDEKPVSSSSDFFQEYALENPYLQIAENRPTSPNSTEVKPGFGCNIISNPTIATPKEEFQKNGIQQSLNLDHSHSTSRSMSNISSTPQNPFHSHQRAQTRCEILHIDKRYENLAFF